MKTKHLHGFVAYILAFIAVLTGLGALVGLVAVYTLDRFSGLSSDGKFDSLLALILLVARLALFGHQFTYVLAGIGAR